MRRGQRVWLSCVPGKDRIPPTGQLSSLRVSERSLPTVAGLTSPHAKVGVQARMVFPPQWDWMICDAQDYWGREAVLDFAEIDVDRWTPLSETPPGEYYEGCPGREVLWIIRSTSDRERRTAVGNGCGGG